MAADNTIEVGLAEFRKLCELTLSEANASTDYYARMYSADVPQLFRYIDHLESICKETGR